MGILSLNSKEIDNLSLGMLGFDAVTSGTKTPPSGFRYFALVADEDSTFSALSGTGDNLPSVQRSEGRIIFGDFKSVTVNVGTVLAYYKPVAR